MFTNPPVIAYHASCSDGQAAGFVAWKAHDKQAYTVAVNYDLHKKTVEEIIETLAKGVPIGQLCHTHLYIVDFSFPLGILRQLGKVFQYVTVIDHHKTFQDELEAADLPTQGCEGANAVVTKFYGTGDNVRVRFCMQESGALMTWRFFYPNQSVPDFIRYTSDRDLFTFVDPKTRPFASGMGRHRGKSWMELEEVYSEPEKVIRDGELLEEMSAKRIDAVLSKDAKKIQVVLYRDDSSQVFTVGAYNATPDITSDLLAKYVNTPGNPQIGMTYMVGSDNLVYCSLRSHKDVDCSVIAKTFGGGGHAQACGFTLPLKQFVCMLESNSLTGMCPDPCNKGS